MKMLHTRPARETKSISFTKRLYALAYFIIPLMSGALSLFLGRDINWDLKNYHYYNAYAFIEHRSYFDIAPAQLQTFINPIADLPFYWMTKHFPSWVAGFVFGFVHGFNLSLIFLIFWKITSYSHGWLKLFFGICVITVAAIAPGFISELGNTMHNNLTSLFVLTAIFFLIIASEKLYNGEHKLDLFRIGMAGMIMGFGVGVKPSITIFAISSAIVLAVLQGTWLTRLIGLLTYSITCALGGLASAGFWWWELWMRFRNPFFPFYNHIFKSPYFTSAPVVWSSFLPKELWEYFFWPFIFSLNGYRVNQLYYSDIRFALLYLLCIAWLVVYIAKKAFRINLVTDNDRKYFFDVRSSNYLLLFFLCSYVLWIKESSTYRFMIPLELLVPLCFLIILERFVHSRKLQIALVTVAILATFILFKPFNWGRLDWSNSYFSVDTSRFDPSENAVVVMLGLSPTSYVIPHFPPDYRFIRPEGNMGMQQDENNQFITEIMELLKKHQGPLYILYNKNEKGFDFEKSLARWELRIKNNSCFVLKINTPDNLVMCRVFETTGTNWNP